MKSNDASVTIAYDSTDSSGTSTYKGSKPDTDCKPVSDCYPWNDKGRRRLCRCVKAGNICTNSLLLQHIHCMNNKHIRNISVTSTTTTINDESTNVLPNLLANSTPPPANQITQSATSYALTLFDKPVPDCKSVSDCCRCNDKSNCRCCSCVKVENTCTNCIPLIRRGHCRNDKRIWNTSLMSNATTIKKETT